ncbi:MAG: efflux RND transporter permease subunit [Planctomycetota bacterium]|jgi:Cu(I)/Ag(I) efflux system membrane protein CusA/SilA
MGTDHQASPEGSGLIARGMRFFLEQKLVVVLMVLVFAAAAVRFAPFDWKTGWFQRDPVPVDAIPDIGENQQIVFTEWMGRSPQDVEDQITYPLTVSLLGIPSVKTVRSYSMFGFSTIYVIFEEDVDFYWSRSRVLEKLASLPAGTLPGGVRPTLGPDATALGQVFWYTLEGRAVVDGRPTGTPTGGWDLDELRSIQDWKVRYELMSVKGVSEVASVGGFVKEYQVDVDPDAMRAYGVTLEEVFRAVKMSNVDVGARTIEVNRAEYVIRGIGFIKKLSDLENTVVKAREGVAVYIRNVARVSHGPALRRGALDKEGAEAVGGVVVVRFGENPLATIERVKQRIVKIAPSLPEKMLADGTRTRVTVVPFYDRTGLIQETLDTLKQALWEEILITVIVVLVMVMHLRSSALISGLLPLAVGMCFIAMKLFGVDANIVALSGIAIAIGTIVDMGIVVCENILKHMEEAGPDESRLEVVHRASCEVGSAVLTAIATTVVSFLPVFTMTGAEGKLFKPLAWTKTFALVSSVLVALLVLPAFAQLLFAMKVRKGALRRASDIAILLAGLGLAAALSFWAGVAVVLVAAYRLGESRLPEKVTRWGRLLANGFAVLVVGVLLTSHWMPLGPDKGLIRNLVFAGVLIGGVLGFFKVFERFYGPVLKWCLRHKLAFLALPALILFVGVNVWFGFGRVFGFLPQALRQNAVYSYFAHSFPGLGKEFMPPLDEGSYLLMPTTMPHASIGEAMDVLRKQDMAIRAIHEVDSVVGKIGRAESPLDPAPISMIETIITYKPEYVVDPDTKQRLLFKYDPNAEDVFRDEAGLPVTGSDGKEIPVEGRYFWEGDRLVPDGSGRPFRLWRPSIRKPDDIWNEIVEASKLTGTTSAPRLQPISARIVMLQSGMRAPMGIKVKGDDLKTIERVALNIEKLLKSDEAPPSIKKEAVIADRIVGKAYLELDWDRGALDRYGVHVRRAQDVVEVAIGGKRLTTTVEGRERYPVRVRYMRELRDTMESLGRILVSAANGAQVPVAQLLQQQVDIELNRGAAVRAGLSAAEIAERVAAVLKNAGIDEDDYQLGGSIPFPIRVRSRDEFRSKARSLRGVTLRSADGGDVPLRDLLLLSYPRDTWYRRGPMVIKSEDTRLVGYVLFDMRPGNAEVDVVEAADRFLQSQEAVFRRAEEEARRRKGGGELSPEEKEVLPGLNRRGCDFKFAGNYENQVRSQKTLAVVLPLALGIIFLILYFQFRRASTTLMVFSGIAVAWAGGFIMIWLYGQGWFMNFSVFGVEMRGLFQMHTVNLSVAVWVGFLALFGIATDDGVVMATYLDQSFGERRPTTVEEVRLATLDAGLRRVRPCLMTTATTVLALIPVLTSSGRGSDVMVPMAIPSFGGMTIEVVTMLVVPVLYAAMAEWRLAAKSAVQPAPEG